MRLIDADALREKAHKLPNGYNHGWFHKCVDEMIDTAPTIDPVKRGKWLRTPTWWAYCSVCGMEPPNESNETTDFCPNCGAKMDKED
ncbi:MAG: hypothetical protein J6T17_06350 [Clostridia bacterium]|nr:hypothetical protein [Clostridia bacterium]